jgi:hypothetical protein
MSKHIYPALLAFGLLCFLCITAGGIHKKVQATVAPPVYDPLSYYSKAESVSTAIGHGKFNLLNVGNPGRPFGSALLLYPFGFKPSIKSYLFRATFVPILLWGCALAVCLVPLIRSRIGLLVALSISIGMLTLPLFYQFEISDEFTRAYGVNMGGWGLVDVLQASVAGLSVALLLNGLRTRSLPISSSAWMVAGFTLFIKPSGMLVMATILGIALVELIGQLVSQPSGWRNSLKFAAKSLSIALIVFAVIGTLSLKSKYLDSGSIAYFRNATSICVGLFADIRKLDFFLAFIPSVVGWWWLCPMVIATICFAARFVGSGFKREFWPLTFRLIGLFAVIAGGCFWLLFFAGPQHRYLFPFILMMVVWFLPDLFQYLARAQWKACASVATYCLCPAVLLVALLWSPHPSIGLQKAIGVNLSVGQYGQESALGQMLLDEAAKLGRVLKIYSVGGTRAGVVEMGDWIQSVDHGDAPHKFDVMRPVDWIHSPGIKIDDVLQCDFLLLEDVGITAAGASPRTISNLWIEIEQFKQFAYSGCKADANGAVLFSDDRVKVLRILDRQKFADAFRAWAQSIQWENDFHERNKAFLDTSK